MYEGDQLRYGWVAGGKADVVCLPRADNQMITPQQIVDRLKKAF